MSNPLFLLGAGFNRDAAAEVGPIECHSINIGKYTISPNYPLLADMWKICFPGQSPDPSIGIEEKIQESISQGDLEPVKKLCTEIAKCDYYLIPSLIENDSCYKRFFKRFLNSHFLTFNYDSLVEIFFLGMGGWNPSDGYGIPVDLNPILTNGSKFGGNKSRNLAIHLHGSMCIYESGIEWDHTKEISFLKLKDKPIFKFDPSTVGKLFYPFQRASMTIGEDREIEKRIIAPVPDKSTGLKGEFVKEMYNKAQELLKNTDLLICIGYDFNEADESSYAPILNELSEQKKIKMVIISPNSLEIYERVIQKRSNLKNRIFYQEIKFKEWVLSGFQIH